MVKQALTFWVSNLSNRNVSLADLNLTIPAFRSVNLLDKRHYQYTLEQLQKSVTNGSIYKKSDKIKVRQIAPEVVKSNMPILRETFIPTRERSILELKETHYEELDISSEDEKKKQEEYANENAELAQLDEIKPSVAIKG